MFLGAMVFSGRILFGEAKYAIVANQQGLLLDRYGLLPWDSIMTIYAINYETQKTNRYKSLVIRLKNIDCIKRRGGWFIKLQLFTFSFIASNAILISCLEEDEALVASRLYELMLFMQNNQDV